MGFVFGVLPRLVWTAGVAETDTGLIFDAGL